MLVRGISIRDTVDADDEAGSRLLIIARTGKTRNGRRLGQVLSINATDQADAQRTLP